MTGVPTSDIPASEISKYEAMGFVVLKGRIDHTLVRKARDSVTERVKEVQETVVNDVLFVTAYGGAKWPPECEALFEAVEKLVPPTLFSKPGSKLRIGGQIGVYQPNKIQGRGPPNAFYYTIGLCEGGLQSGVNMPVYYEKSHDDTSELVEHRLGVEEGDVLVWDGRTRMRSTFTEGGSFMMIRHSWD